MSNINSYFNSRGIPVPQFNAIGLDGASNSPGESDADGEVELDCEVAGAIAPGARFDVYFAQNTDQSFLDAISQAVHSDATIISISWGGPESGWTRMAMRAMNMVFEQARALGKNVFCASGDSGATDGETTLQVDFPASSPNVIACGGTTLILRADGSISSERVWNENASNEGCGGGGVSRFFAKPSYQGKSNVPKAPNGIVGRGVPDVSGNSDPESGYLIVSQGAEQVTGGTSATAPLFAGLTALLQEALGRQAGFLNPVLYSNPEACNDVVSGDNVTDGQGYKASTSWDCASGLGSVQGNKLLSLLAK